MPLIAEDFKAINAGLKKLEGKAVDESAVVEAKAEDVQAIESYWGGFYMGTIPPGAVVSMPHVIAETANTWPIASCH